MEFDGEARLGSFGVTGTGAPETVSTGELSVQFVADPGYAFTTANVRFGSFGWLNTSFGGHYNHTGTWSFSTGNYVGDATFSFFESSWAVTGQSGSFNFYNPYQGSSGSGGSRSLMNGSMLLNGVSSFNVGLSTTATASLTTEYGISNFVVNAVTAPVVVPEPSAYAVLAGALALALATWRRIRAS